jgi:hypothetical protein
MTQNDPMNRSAVGRPAMKPNIQLMLASFCLALTCACSSIAENHRLSWLNTADPKRDCEIAVARGDLRFWAVNGFTSDMVLGTDQHGADRTLIRAHGIRTIVGTSDTSTSRLNHRASEYARTYNTILLRYLRATARLR